MTPTFVDVYGWGSMFPTLYVGAWLSSPLQFGTCGVSVPADTLFWHVVVSSSKCTTQNLCLSDRLCFSKSFLTITGRVPSWLEQVIHLVSPRYWPVPEQSGRNTDELIRMRKIETSWWSLPTGFFSLRVDWNMSLYQEDVTSIFFLAHVTLVTLVKSQHNNDRDLL